MSVLRIYGSLSEVPARAQWALAGQGTEPAVGDARLSELPRRAERVQLVVPASQVLITRARVPAEARRRAGSLAFAVEEQTAADPESNQVSWIGNVGEADVLAVMDKPGLARWRSALDEAGIHNYEVHSEILMLPWNAGEWSLAWNGREGFVRTGQFEGTATDCGDRTTPPLTLRLMLEDVTARSAGPRAIALYTTDADAAPDLEAWTRELGIAIRHAGTWDWRRVPPEAGISLAQERQRWRGVGMTAARLRPAAWIVAAALALHAVALIIDWSALAHEQRSLRKQMEARFRAAFPDAVAVVDPVLQMRRKLAEARHAAGQPDNGDFLPMLAKIVPALKDLPAGALRVVSYESTRMTLEVASRDEALLRRIVARLEQTGLRVDPGAAAARPAAATVVITVRAS